MSARGRGRAGLVWMLIALAAPGCSVNPATGEASFTAFMSREVELRTGREEHPKVLSRFGGVYADPELGGYVAAVGGRLARGSELPDLPYSFTILDSDSVNAMALPGGYVYVTRGLLALVSSEAELAGVLAHEIGHLTARHAAQRYSHAVLAQVGAAALGAAVGAPIGDLAGYGASAYVAGYSREQEYEADLLAVRYLTRNGYQPRAMADLLAKLEANSALSARLSGRPGEADSLDIMSRHPRAVDRVVQAIEAAQGTTLAAPVVGEEAYLAAIDGLPYGGDRAGGIVRGQTFLQPAQGFRFEVPPGFRLVNGPRQVVAHGREGARIVFDADRQAPPAMAMAEYLAERWGRSLRLTAVEPIVVDGLAAATGAARVTIREGVRDLRLVAIRAAPDVVYRLLFLTPPALTAALNPELRRTTYSFRRLSAAEAAAARPLRIRLVSVAPGDTLDGLARRMAPETEGVALLQVLNGLGSGGLPAPGAKLKIVSD